VFSVGQTSKLFLGSNNLFSEKSGNKSFNDYIITTSSTAPYDERQIINYDASIIENFLDNSNDNLLVRNTLNNSVDIYRNLGRNVVKEYTVYSNNVSGFGFHGSIDNDYVFLSTLSSVEIYKRNNYDWNYYSSITTLSSIPTNIKFKNNQGIISYIDGSAQIFENDGLGNYSSVFYLSAISNASEGFGYSIAMGDYFAASNSRGSRYYQTDVAYPIAGTKASILAHAGRTDVANQTVLDSNDYNAGVGYNLAGFDLAARYYTNSNKTAAFQTANTVGNQKLYRNALVLSVSKTFN
jgi:hypothetical protein